jgi:hypothetical protein
MLRVCQAREQAPPIVDQRHRAGEQPATMQILCREAAPAPLVLQFIKDVLTIGPVAIQLAQGQDFVIQRRNQRSVFPQFLVRFDLAKAQQQFSF